MEASYEGGQGPEGASAIYGWMDGENCIMRNFRICAPVIKSKRMRSGSGASYAYAREEACFQASNGET